MVMHKGMVIPVRTPKENPAPPSHRSDRVRKSDACRWRAHLAARNHSNLPSAVEHKAPDRCSAEIGRASCRERVCQYVLIQVVAAALPQKEVTYTTHIITM